MKKIFILLIALLFFCQNTFSIATYEDSLKNVLGNMKKDTLWIQKTDELFKFIVESNLDEALKLNDEVFSVSNKLNYEKGIALANQQRGEIAWHTLQNDTAQFYLDKALEISERIGDARRTASVYTSMGINYVIQQWEEKAADMIYKSLKLCEGTDDTSLVALNYENLAIIFWHMKNFSKAGTYHIKALNLFRKINDVNKLILVLNNYSAALQDMNRFSEAAVYLQQGIKLCEKSGSYSALPSCYNNLGWSYIMLDSLSPDLSRQKKDSLLHLAIFYIDKSEKLASAHNDPEIIAADYSNLALCYFKLHDKERAILFNNKALVEAKKFHQLNVLADASHQFFEIYNEKKEYQTALTYYKDYVAWNDSAYAIQKTTDIERLHLQFETEKKDDKIALLNKDKALQQKEIEKQRTARNSFIAGFILVSLLVGVTYNRFLLKQKANRQLSLTLNELKSTQEQLVESEKMAAFGALTSRVAHEIQNPLNFVNNFSDLSEEYALEIMTSQNEEEKKEAVDFLMLNLKKIKHHGKRAEDIVNKLQEHIRAGTAHEFFKESGIE